MTNDFMFVACYGNKKMHVGNELPSDANSFLGHFRETNSYIVLVFLLLCT